MQLINVPTMQEVIRDVVIGENEPCWFHGEPGCGKSEGASQAITALGAQLIDFRVGQYDTVDFKGYPQVDEHQVMMWARAGTLPFVGNEHLFDPDKIKVVFIDEADHGKPGVLGVLYQLVNERRVGEHVLMPNTFIMLAGNRPQDKGVGGKVPMPLNLRCTHYEVGPDADAWITWALEQPRIPGELIGFMSLRKDLISTFDPASPEKAQAVGRTWAKVGKYYTNQTMREVVRDASIEGAVGRGPATEFLGFCRIMHDLVDLKTIEADPLTAPISEKPEVRWATSVAIAGEMALRPDSVTAFHQYLRRNDADFLILAWQLGVRRNEVLLGAREFVDVARTHQAIFAAASCR